MDGWFCCPMISSSFQINYGNFLVPVKIYYVTVIAFLKIICNLKLKLSETIRIIQLCRAQEHLKLNILVHESAEEIYKY